MENASRFEESQKSIDEEVNRRGKRAEPCTRSRVHIRHPEALEYFPQIRVPCRVERVFEVEVHSNEFGVLFHFLF